MLYRLPRLQMGFGSLRAGISPKEFAKFLIDDRELDTNQRCEKYHDQHGRGTRECNCLRILFYHQHILNRLRRRLDENISNLKSYQSPQSPRIYGLGDISQGKAKAESTAELLLTDFKFFLSRTEYLSGQYLGGMSVCMISATIEKSQHRPSKLG